MLADDIAENVDPASVVFHLHIAVNSRGRDANGTGVLFNLHIATHRDIGNVSIASLFKLDASVHHQVAVDLYTSRPFRLNVSFDINPVCNQDGIGHHLRYCLA